MGLRGFDGQGCILADDMGLGKTLQVGGISSSSSSGGGNSGSGGDTRNCRQVEVPVRTSSPR